MSLTARDIIKGAMKKLGVLAAGREPSAAQAVDGLTNLQGLYNEFVGQGLFGRLIPTLVSAATYEAHENERVICNTSTTTVTLPDEITVEWADAYETASYSPVSDYGFANVSVLPRAPRDCAVIQITNTANNTSATSIYDAPQGRWVAIDALALTSTAPMSDRYGEALKAILAVRWAPEFNIEPSTAVTGQANSGRYLLSSRPDRSSRLAVGEYM